MTQFQSASDFYHRQLQIHSENTERLKQLFRRIALGRLLTILLVFLFGYLGISNQENWWLGAVIAFSGFVILMNLHSRVSGKLRLSQTLVHLNKTEIAFLESGLLPFADGNEYHDPHHPYSYDLDIFGPHSLFQHLNRTKTVMGNSHLAKSLLYRATDRQISERQAALQELTSLPEWRQLFSAKAEMANDSEKIIRALGSWSAEQDLLPGWLTILSYLLPATGLSLTLAGSLFGYHALLMNLAGTVFILNLILLASRIKQMNREIAHGDKINETLLRYSELLRSIENTPWKSQHLNDIRSGLLIGNSGASQQLHELSRIFAALESLQNGFGAILFNGTFLYHLHAYRKLQKWKSIHAVHLQQWLEVIGELEMLVSFANLSFNNPDFTYPEINSDNKLVFNELGHPLIPKTKRVANSVDFSDKPFIVLTGSNMSGKSTFLRTLGTNMVLANAGSSVCAAHAGFQPMDILVSMRLSDSLSDSESYFFAEVKRLHEIMQELDKKRCFILLDEILRGTNSDDKRTGTIEVLKNVISRKAIGAIATHDLEVCQTTFEYPGLLTNKCFEVEISDNELHFDYRLRDGICKNKSATFLMKKMGII